MGTKHCVSLELAKQLKEAGWKKETEFWWVPSKNGKTDYISDCKGWVYRNTLLPAPLATEISEELSYYREPNLWLTVRKLTQTWEVGYMFNESWLYQIEDVYLPDVLAKMWLFLNKEK